MSNQYEELKKRYNQMSDEITRLYKEQQTVLEQMQAACPHTNTSVVQPDFYFEPEKFKRKCKDCGNYVEDIVENSSQ